MSGSIDTARAAWGEECPDWVMTLATACAETSQNKVATQINRSASLVSAVLSKKYKGDMVAVEEVVRGVFESAMVTCPVLGEIASNACRDWQLKARSFLPVTSERVSMYHACNRCSRCRKEGA